MRNIILRMTALEALANIDIKSYKENNSAVFEFIDSSNGDTLSGLFFDEFAVNNKIVKALGGTFGGAEFSIIKTLSKAQVNALDVTPVLITAEDLGLVAGEGALVDGAKVRWVIEPDGLPFILAALKLISVKNANNDLIGSLLEGQVTTAAKLTLKFPHSSSREVLENQTIYTITVDDPITDGGANSFISIQLFYNKVKL